MHLRLRLLAAALVCLTLPSCATLHSWAQINSGGTPRFGTTISLPLGDGGKK